MSDWRTEQRRQRGEHIDDTAGARKRAGEVLGGLQSFFIGDTPSEMAFNAATMGALPLKALRVPMMGLSAMTAADDAEASGPLQKLMQRLVAKKVDNSVEDLGRQYMTKHIGPAQSVQVFTDADYRELQEALEFYARPRVLSPERSRALTSLLNEAQHPGMKTHVLYSGRDFSEPTSAFQLTNDHELGDIGLYMPNLVALMGQKGTGTQALQEARRSGPYGLIATPSSRPFYDKLIQRLDNFQSLPDEDLQGIAYQYKKDGGLVEAEDDFAYPGMF